MKPIEKLYELMVSALENRDSSPTDSEYEELAIKCSEIIKIIPEFKDSDVISKEEIDEVISRLQTKFAVHMNTGIIFDDGFHEPWLGEKSHEIKPYYWSRYKSFLLKKKQLSPLVVGSLESITDNILDYLQDPDKEGSWDRRGMVVGHVQSGKTSNYTGLICKAADAGYKVIIVLAGMLNSLRNQTQERLDSDFLGYCTRLQKNIGVGLSSIEENKKPVCFTTSLHDFKKHSANTITSELGAFNRPVLFVLKKNKSTLENLFEWLDKNNPHGLKDYPMLMIDDEADHASINTKASSSDPTTINRAIRNLLCVFSKSSFVGYTATPFANIFIDPKDQEEMVDGEIFRDLFPRHFILSLDPPSNYFGGDQIFAEDSKHISLIDDHEGHIPTGHKKTDDISTLPRSLLDAINCYILIFAIRKNRDDRKTFDHSMMINVSVYKDIQNQITNLVSFRIKEIFDSIRNYNGLKDELSLKDPNILSLFDTFKDHYEDVISWSDVKKNLLSAVSNIDVISVNSSLAGKKLDYDQDLWPNGRKVIAIGGLSLSRGLTLEGLCVSYFLRNSKMYDTLLQMGRWFGYRDGYGDLCKIFLTGEAEGWYRHIHQALSELRADFKELEKQQPKLTPIDVGLKVRSDPTSLIVTARNKMRMGKKIAHMISLEGRLIETLCFDGSDKTIQKNLNAVDNLLGKLPNFNLRENNGYVWKDVEIENVELFLSEYSSHPGSYRTFPALPLVNHLNKLKEEGLKCDILVKTKTPKPEDPMLPLKINLKGGMPGRNEDGNNAENERYEVAFGVKNTISFRKNARLGEKHDEAAGLSEEQLTAIYDKHGSESNINPRFYRDVIPERNPLLIIHLIKILNAEKFIVGYGLSFPGSTTGRQKNLVEYIVNPKMYEELIEEVLEDEE